MRNSKIPKTEKDAKVSFDCDPTKLLKFDAVAKKKYMSRAAYLRLLVDNAVKGVRV